MTGLKDASTAPASSFLKLERVSSEDIERLKEMIRSTVTAFCAQPSDARIDLRSLPAYAFDSEDTEEVDDAISVEWGWSSDSNGNHESTKVNQSTVATVVKPDQGKADAEFVMNPNQHHTMDQVCAYAHDDMIAMEELKNHISKEPSVMAQSKRKQRPQFKRVWVHIADVLGCLSLASNEQAGPLQTQTQAQTNKQPAQMQGIEDPDVPKQTSSFRTDLVSICNNLTRGIESVSIRDTNESHGEDALELGRSEMASSQSRTALRKSLDSTIQACLQNALIRGVSLYAPAGTLEMFDFALGSEALSLRKQSEPVQFEEEHNSSSAGSTKHRRSPKQKTKVSKISKSAPTRKRDSYDALAISVGFHIDIDGDISDDIIICESIVRVKRFTYTELINLFSDPSLFELLKLEKRREQFRQHSGGSTIHVPKPEIRVAPPLPYCRHCLDGYLERSGRYVDSVISEDADDLRNLVWPVSLNGLPNQVCPSSLETEEKREIVGCLVDNDFVCECNCGEIKLKQDSSSNFDDNALKQMVTEMMIATGSAIGKYGKMRGLRLPFRLQSKSDEKVVATAMRTSNFLLREERLAQAMKSSQTQFGIAGPHAALGVDCYVQATSPIRRSMDLISHAILKFHLQEIRLGKAMRDQAANFHGISDLDQLQHSLRESYLLVEIARERNQLEKWVGISFQKAHMPQAVTPTVAFGGQVTGKEANVTALQSILPSTPNLLKNDSNGDVCSSSLREATSADAQRRQSLGQDMLKAPNDSSVTNLSQHLRLYSEGIKEMKELQRSGNRYWILEMIRRNSYDDLRTGRNPRQYAATIFRWKILHPDAIETRGDNVACLRGSCDEQSSSLGDGCLWSPGAIPGFDIFIHDFAFRIFVGLPEGCSTLLEACDKGYAPGANVAVGNFGRIDPNSLVFESIKIAAVTELPR